MTVGFDAKPAGVSASLATQASALAAQHQVVERRTRAAARGGATGGLDAALESAQRYLSSLPAADPARPHAAAWFLDNYYLIRRVARQVDEELPRDFRCRLPRACTCTGIVAAAKDDLLGVGDAYPLPRPITNARDGGAARYQSQTQS